MAGWFLSGAAGLGGWGFLSAWDQPRSAPAHGLALLKSQSLFCSYGWRFQTLRL